MWVLTKLFTQHLNVYKREETVASQLATRGWPGGFVAIDGRMVPSAVGALVGELAWVKRTIATVKHPTN